MIRCWLLCSCTMTSPGLTMSWPPQFLVEHVVHANQLDTILGHSGRFDNLFPPGQWQLAHPPSFSALEIGHIIRQHCFSTGVLVPFYTATCSHSSTTWHGKRNKSLPRLLHLTHHMFELVPWTEKEHSDELISSKQPGQIKENSEMVFSEHLPEKAANWQSAIMALLPHICTILQIYNLCRSRIWGMSSILLCFFLMMKLQ